jgi:hypothetical protein
MKQFFTTYEMMANYSGSITQQEARNKRKDGKDPKSLLRILAWM